MKSNNDYKIDFAEASKILGKSKRTLSRYIKAGKLNPEIKKSQKGIKYYFNLTELENLKKPDTTGQATRQNIKIDKNNDTLSDLKNIIKFLQEQLKEKDRQIKKEQEGQRKLTIMLNRERNHTLLLEDRSKDKRPDKNDRTEGTTSQSKWQGWFKRLFKVE